MAATEGSLLTIGHSNHRFERFAELLRRYGVGVVADVRSAPYSRHSPQFNRETLKKNLKLAGIGYVFLGKELGARAEDPSFYSDGRVQYARLAQSKAYREGIERLKKGVREHTIAIMCAEREPLDCHRTLLVSRTLDAEGLTVNHILADGRLEPHARSMERLLDHFGLPHHDFFRSSEDLVAEALERQEQRVAYRSGAPAGAQAEGAE